MNTLEKRSKNLPEKAKESLLQQSCKCFCRLHELVRKLHESHPEAFQLIDTEKRTTTWDERRYSDIRQLEEERLEYLKHDTPYQKTLVALTELLVFTSMIPSYEEPSVQANAEFGQRLEFLNTYFSNKEVREKIYNEQQKSFEKEKTIQNYWRLVHRDKSIQLTRPQELKLHSQLVSIQHRKKSLLSTVEKLFEKCPDQLFRALRNIQKTLYTYEQSPKDFEKLKTLTQERTGIITSMSNSLIDLIGITYITHPSSHSSDSIIHSWEDLDYWNRHCKELARRVQASVMKHNKEFLHFLHSIHEPLTYSIENELTESAFQERNINGIFQTISDIFSSVTAPQLQEHILQHWNDISADIRIVLCLIFFAKKSGWKVKEVKDYTLISEQKGYWHSHLGVHVILEDIFEKSIEFQIKDVYGQINDSIGLSSHQTYKQKRVTEVITQLKKIMNTLPQ